MKVVWRWRRPSESGSYLYMAFGSGYKRSVHAYLYPIHQSISSIKSAFGALDARVVDNKPYPRRPTFPDYQLIPDPIKKRNIKCHIT